MYQPSLPALLAALPSRCPRGARGLGSAGAMMERQESSTPPATRGWLVWHLKCLLGSVPVNMLIVFK